MGNVFASGKRSLSICDRCGEQFLLKKLKFEIVKQKKTGLLVCEECWSPDHPQLMLGTFPVYDPQALRDPRKDNSYAVSGLASDGSFSGGSRQIQWGWNPVGGGLNIPPSTPNDLLMYGQVGSVTVTTS